MNEQVETVKSWLLGRVGCPYIYGGTGQACTPEYRRARMDQYPKYADMIRSNCPRLKSGATSCAGCKWADGEVGKKAYDCAQLTRFAMDTVGIALVSGANPQWNKTAFVRRGEIDDMPRSLFALVYREDDDGKKHHTGNYTGDGWVVHAKGHDYGVVRERLESVKLTHYGIPAGLYSIEELRAAGIDVEPWENLPTFRRGSKGKLVKSVQEYLNREIGSGLTTDGIYGAKTEEAVKNFQKSRGLAQDGVIGPKTWAALGYTPEATPVAPAAPEEPNEPTPPEEPAAQEDQKIVSAVKLKEIEACLFDALSVIQAALGKE